MSWLREVRERKRGREVWKARKPQDPNDVTKGNIRGGVQKNWYFCVVGAVGYHFVFSLTFDSEAFKTCKKTIKLFNLCALACLWLTMTVYFDLA